MNTVWSGVKFGEDCVMQRHVFEIYVVAFVLIIGTVSAQICPPGQYRERVTRNCQSCANLCDGVKRPGAVNECQTLCPEYYASRRCHGGEYYDIALSRCEPCSSICVNHRSRGSTDECKQHCPAEYVQSEKGLCLPGEYFDSALSHCDHCSSICQQHASRGTTTDCQKNCPKEFEKSLSSEEAKENNSIGIIIGTVTTCGLLILVAVVAIAVVKNPCRKAPTASGSSVTPDNPHPTVTYVVCPVHTQCVDNCTVSQSSSAEGLQCVEEDYRSSTEEERKFPMAHADLPYSARTDN